MGSGRYRGLRPNPQALGVVPLAAGEASKPIRVRASIEVHDWLKGMSAAQVGEVLTYAHQQALRGSRKAVKVPTKAVEGSSTQVKKASENAAGFAASGSAGSGEGGSRVELGVIPSDLKPHHAPIVQALQAGATLQQVDGLWKLRGAGENRTLKTATVEMLLRVSVLTH